MTRKLKNWIEGFIEYTENLPSEPLLRRWTAVSTLAGVLERKVWAVSMGKRLYPNLYIFLVAPPGIGKTVCITEAKRLWNKIPHIHIGASSLTKASFIDELEAAERNVTDPQAVPAVQSFHALTLASNELAVLLPGYDNEFMNALTDIYDGGKYDEKRRTKDRFVEVQHPFFNFIACTTPSFLSDLLPEGAWNQGFMSRVLMVYSGVQKPLNLFDHVDPDEKLFKALVHDLKAVHELKGEIVYTPEAKEVILEWYDGGLYRQSGKPEHPNLVNYNSRRHMHMLKLCQILSVAYGDSMRIEADHAIEAIAMLLEVEDNVPEIFKAMSSGGDFAVIEGAWYFAYKLYMQKKDTPIRKELMIQYLQQRVPVHSVERLLSVMVASGMLKEVHVNKIGPAFVPQNFEKV